MTARFVVAGESLVDVVTPQRGPLTREPGGSPLNVAVGLARLDVPTLLITRIGDDGDGRLVEEHARSSGVVLDPGSVHPGLVTSTATALLDADHAASYTFDLAWDLPPRELPDDAVGLHVGSLGALLPPGDAAVHDLVRQAEEAELFVSYDPNVRPAFVGDVGRCWGKVAALAQRARLVKVSEDDLRLLHPDEPLDDVAAAMLVGATELVVVTHGAEGATAYRDGSKVNAPGSRVEVVDTVGAGDSFMAALVAVLLEWEVTAPGPGRLQALDEDRLRTLLVAAGAAAAATCARRGADPPRRSELSLTWPL
ncbi:MAG TPA: carbohydrate kinase [Nocardioidaceae bacterium]|jgi:fructokinase|nr:carbohydrate kinase [Nocardioidaceae bacterium]